MSLPADGNELTWYLTKSHSLDSMDTREENSYVDFDELTMSSLIDKLTKLDKNVFLS